MSAPASERNRAAPSMAQARKAALERLRAAGIEIASQDGSEHVIVGARFYFMPSIGFWREIRGGRLQGYGTGRLIEEVKKPERPLPDTELMTVIAKEFPAV